MVISLVGMVFVATFEFYLLFLFILGGAKAGLFLVALILTMEMVSAQKRVLCCVSSKFSLIWAKFWLPFWRSGNETGESS